MPKATEKQQTRLSAGIAYTLTRRKVKNINLRVRPDGTVAASASPRTPAAAVDAFVAAKADWIRAAQEKMRAQAQQTAALPLPDKAAALAHFARLSEQVYPAFAHLLGTPPTIKVRSMTSRWGVCAPAKRQITFALQLYNQPPAAQLYVVVHEYCHFLVPNHSPTFWAEVEKLLPDWKARRRLLRQPL